MSQHSSLQKYTFSPLCRRCTACCRGINVWQTGSSTRTSLTVVSPSASSGFFSSFFPPRRLPAISRYARKTKIARMTNRSTTSSGNEFSVYVKARKSSDDRETSRRQLIRECALPVKPLQFLQRNCPLHHLLDKCFFHLTGSLVGGHAQKIGGDLRQRSEHEQP